MTTPSDRTVETKKPSGAKTVSGALSYSILVNQALALARRQFEFTSPGKPAIFEVGL